MKGVILAGGSGTRLFPSTKVTNKHLLPVYNKPMIFYSIETMIRAGIRDILILPGKDNAGAFAQLLGSGAEMGVNFFYRVQESAGGLAYAVSLAEDFVGKDNFLVMFGDNLIFDDLKHDVDSFAGGCTLFLKEVPDPHRFGVADVTSEGVITSIIEKPQVPKSNLAVIGVYLYDASAFEHIRALQPSERGELEITDLNNRYINTGAVKARYVEGPWFDVGTHESLVEAASYLMTQDRPLQHQPRAEKASVSYKIAAGFILYHAEKYLPDFLKSVRSQNYAGITWYAIDNNEGADNADVAYLRAHAPEVVIIRPGYNTGFGKGHNILIDRARQDGAAFYVALNFDLLLEPSFISELMNTMLKNQKTGCVTGKIRRWDFAHKDRWGNEGRTNFIDSTGIQITKGHRFLDRGHGEIDHGQYDAEEEIFGSSGAAALYRMSALEDVAYVNEHGIKEYFDGLMFMYKEDVDLAYRLQLAGYACRYTPLAICYHDRTIALAGTGLFATMRSRLKRERKYKEWSLLNHHIILSKYLSTSVSFPVWLSTFWFECKQFLYILFFEPYLMRQFFHYLKIIHQIGDRKRQIKQRVAYAHAIERWMR